MTTEHNIIVETNSKKLALAVYLQDDFSGNAALGEINVRLKESNKVSIRNPSLYYIFTNLPKGSYLLQTSSDNYFDKESQINTETRNPDEPLVLVLLPKPSYQFPPGTTLARGILLFYSNKKPVMGAYLRGMVGTNSIESITTEKGEFVIYFGTVTEDMIISLNGKTYIKPIIITINYGSSPPKFLKLNNVEVGKTKSLGATYV